jgi:hypothetical protein
MGPLGGTAPLAGAFGGRAVVRAANARLGVATGADNRLHHLAPSNTTYYAGGACFLFSGLLNILPNPLDLFSNSKDRYHSV